MQAWGRGEARAESERHSLRIAALIFGAGALSTFAVAAVQWRTPIPGYSAPGLAVFASLALVAALAFLVMWWRRLQMPPWVYFVFWTAGIILTAVGQVFAAAPPSFAPMLASFLCIFAAAFLPRMLSIACVLCFGIAMAVVFWAQDGWDPPIAYWLVVTIATIMCAIAVAQLVERAEVQTTRANAAAAELQDVNATLEARVAAQVEEIRVSRARIVAVAANERRRMERDLHDGAQQYLTLAGLQLARLASVIDSDPVQTRVRMAETRSTLEIAQTELRNLAHGIYPEALEAEGVAQALREAAARSPVTVVVECDGIGRLPREAEAALYFCCVEALQNVSKYAGDGATATVSLTRHDRRVEFTVTDDGVGFDTESHGQGQTNMRDRMGALGGDITIISAPGAGTRVSGWVPVDGPS